MDLKQRLKYAGVSLAVLSCSAISSWAALHLAPQWSLDTRTLSVASYLCALNGVIKYSIDAPFSGAPNVKGIRRTGPDKYTISCDNGAHFFETLTWDTNPNEHIQSKAAE